jgi:tetratricopeptide (TPR) repeat protein
MDFIQNLRERRLPQYLSAYVFGGLGLVRFIEFLEGRLQFSPHWVNLTAVGLLLLLPAVTILNWSQGRPGKDRWGKLEKIAIPINLVMVVVILFVFFGGKDFGALTQKVAIADETGQVTERVVPKSEYRKRVAFFALKNAGAEDQNWLCHGVPIMLDFDLSQDAFVDSRQAAVTIVALRNEGYPDGLNVPVALQRKIAREAHYPLFFNGTFRTEGDITIIETKLQASDNGKLIAERQFQGPNILDLIDEISLQLRKDLDIPSGYIEENVDVTIAEILSEDIEAIRLFTQAAMLISAYNNWEGANELLMEAVERDPTFAMAQYVFSASNTMVGSTEGTATAIAAAMDNLYRLPERVQLQIKTYYYYNHKQDPDKGMAIVEMWTRLYPQDSDAFKQKAFLHSIRGENEAAIAAFEQALKIDPHQYELLQQIGNIYKALDEFSKAESYLRQYADQFSTRIEAWTQLASLYLNYGKPAEAKEALDQALLIEPNHIAARVSLSEAMTLEGQFDEARDLLEQLAAEANSPQERFEVLDRQMSLCQFKGQISSIYSFLDRYVEIAGGLYSPPEVTIIHALRLPVLTEIGRADEALASIESLAANTMPPITDFVNYFRINPLIKMNRLDEVEAIINQTEATVEQLKLEVWRSRLLEARSNLADARGDYVSAARLLRECVEITPLSSRMQRRLGRVLRLQGKYGESRKVLERLLKLNPNNGRTNFEMAQLYNDTDNVSKALEHLRVALITWQDADPDFAPAKAAHELQSKLNSLP